MTARTSPVAMAHRGFCGGADHVVENSSASFAAAEGLGYTWVETDVHATTDGVLLAFHDPTLDRTTDATGVIAELPWSVVSRARIGGTEPIALLDDLFTRFPTLHLNIDVKAEGAVQPLIDCLERHAAHERVRIASFSERRRRAVLDGLSRPVRSSPGQTRMAWLWVVSHLPVVGERVFAAAAAGVDAVQIPERLGWIRVLDKPLRRAARAAGVEVHVWTVNERCDMERLLDMGVDGIITDRADVLKAVLMERHAW